MASQIRVVEEQAMAPDGQGGLTAIERAARLTPSFGASTAPPEPDTRVLSALQALSGRLQAVEGVVSGVPKAASLIRALLRALGAHAMVCLALFGCLGLAGAAAVNPSWQGLATFAAFSVLVYLPIAALAYFRGN